MAHNVSDRNRRTRDLEFNRAEILRAENVVRLEVRAAADVVAIWESRLAAAAELFFSPTIGAALAADKPVLGFYCPGCHVAGETDLRRFDRHPETLIAKLVPAISCRRCSPYPPFARLIGLRRLNEDERRYWGYADGTPYRIPR